MGTFLSSLSVDSRGDQHFSPRIELNGQPVPGLRRLTVDWSRGSATIATLEIMVGELHIDAEAFLQIKALMEAREGGQI